MIKKRKTVEQKRAEVLAAERQVLDHFLVGFAKVKSIKGAMVFYQKAPRQQHAPDKKFYANLGFFLVYHFAPPDDASAAELMHYLRIVTASAVELDLSVQRLARIQEGLKAAIAARREHEARGSKLARMQQLDKRLL